MTSSSSTAYPDAPAVAAKAAREFLGGPAQALLAIAMTISALSAMNGSMLTGARVPYAVAKDGLAPARLAKLSEGARVPAVSVVVQGVWASVLALSGRFDDLTDAVMFASWLFYALNAGSVLMLRRREPDRQARIRQRLRQYGHGGRTGGPERHRKPDRAGAGGRAGLHGRAQLSSARRN